MTPSEDLPRHCKARPGHTILTKTNLGPIDRGFKPLEPESAGGPHPPRPTASDPDSTRRLSVPGPARIPTCASLTRMSRLLPNMASVVVHRVTERSLCQRHQPCLPTLHTRLTVVPSSPLPVPRARGRARSICTTYRATSSASRSVNHRFQIKMKIAVVGSGVSGLGATWVGLSISLERISGSRVG